MEKLLSAVQVAEYLNIHPKTLYKLLRGNKIALTYVRIHGHMIAFRPSEVERYIDLHEVVLTGSGRPEPNKKARTRDDHQIAAYEPIEVGLGKVGGRSYEGETIPGGEFMTDEEAQEFFLVHSKK
jgi:excisionase family DNA binding protein